MDDGLGFALIIPLFLLLIPISISFVILYAILRDKKRSIVGSIVGLPFAFLAAFAIPVSDGEGIIWISYAHRYSGIVIFRSLYNGCFIWYAYSFYGTNCH